MSQNESDPVFRAFSKARGDHSEVWFVVYGWGLIWRPVSVKGFFVQGIPFVLGYGWIFLFSRFPSIITAFPLALNLVLLLLPVVAAYIATFYLVRRHSRWI